MTPGARSPEELETLLEDALITSDTAALEALLEPCAVLIGSRYVAGRGQVFQARDTALIVAEDSIGVAVRRDGRWRFAIALADMTTTRNGAHP
jgi:hypothetical protein